MGDDNLVPTNDHVITPEADDAENASLFASSAVAVVASFAAVGVASLVLLA